MLIYCYQFLIVLIVDRQSTAIINQVIVEKICHSVNSSQPLFRYFSIVNSVFGYLIRLNIQLHSWLRLVLLLMLALVFTA